MAFDKDGYYIPQEPKNDAQSVLQQLLNLDQLRRVPKPQPLLKGILNLNSLAWIAGPPGSYKTFLALDYALRVSEHHPVLYVAGEGVAGLADRCDAWARHHNKVLGNMYFLPKAVPVHSVEWYSLCSAATTIGAKLTILDTQARMAGNLDENSVPEMGRYIDGCEALKAATGGCVCSVHHSAKSGAHLRGSSAVQGAADTIITIEVRDKIVGVHNLKQKDMVEFPDHWYRPTEVLESCVLVPCSEPDDWSKPANKKDRYGNARQQD